MQQKRYGLLVIATCLALAAACGDDASSKSDAAAADGGKTSEDAAASSALDASEETADSGASQDAAAAIDGAASASDAGDMVSDSGAGDAGADCSDADPAMVDGLNKALGVWTWSQEVSNGTVGDDLDDCDKSIAYRVGPALLVITPEHPSSYVSCAIKHHSPIPVRSDIHVRPSSCAQYSCDDNQKGPQFAMTWNTATTGAVSAIDAAGKPMGSASFYIVIQPKKPSGYDVLWVANPTILNGYTLHSEVPGTVLSCEL